MRITEEHKKTMSAFFSAFWEIVKGSYEVPAADDPDAGLYWETLLKQCNVLMNRFNDPLINRLVMAYLDGQSCRKDNLHG